MIRFKIDKAQNWKFLHYKALFEKKTLEFYYHVQVKIFFSKCSEKWFTY